MKRNFWDVLDNILTFGYADKMRGNVGGSVGYTPVTAGDPCTFVQREGGFVTIEDVIRLDGQRVRTGNFHKFQVIGSSMSTRDILQGDILLTSPCNGREVRRGDFIVIDVDKEYYRKFKHETARYEEKLRQALMDVHPGEQLEGIVARLKQMNHHAIWLHSNVQRLGEKLELARRAYPERELMLSTTFKNGNLRYSLHPVDLIRYKVEIVARKISKSKVSFWKPKAA